MSGRLLDDANLALAILGLGFEPVVVIDDGRAFVDANDAACELLGRGLDDLRQLRVEDILPASEGVRTPAAWTRFIEAGSWTGIYRIARPDGTTRNVELTARANIALGLHVVVLRDVTARVVAERELRLVNEGLSDALDAQRDRADRSETHLLFALGRIPTVVWTVDRDLRYTYVSQYRHGLSAEAMLGRTDDEIWQPPASTEFIRLKREALRTKARVDGEVAADYPDGPHVMQISLAPLLDASGEAVGVIGATTDVTVFREAERAAARSREELEAVVAERTRELAESRRLIDHVLDQLGVGAWVEDVRTSRRTYVSPGLERIAGYPAAEFFDPVLWRTHVHPEDRAAASEAFDRLEAPELEYRIVDGDGRARWLRERTTVIRADGGTALFQYGICQDVTAVRAAAADQETALRESERRLRELIDGVDAAIGFAEDQHRLRISEQVRGILGRGPEELADFAGWEALVHPDDHPRCREVWDSDATTWTLEYRMRHVDGRWVWIRDRGRRELLPGGELRRQFFIVTDVTAIREIEAAREAAVLAREALYRDLIEGQDAILWIARDDGSDIYISPQVEQVLGYPPERWYVPGFWRTTVHPDDVERVDAAMAAPADPTEIAYRVIAADGRTLWFRDRVRLSRDANGEVRKYGLTIDDTALRAAERELRESEERYRGLIEMQDAFFWEEGLPAHDVRYISPQVERLTGYPAGRFLGDVLFWRSIVHPDDLAMVVEAYDACHVGTLEYRIVRADGAVAWIREHSTLLHDASGGAVGMMGVGVDITTLRVAEEERLAIAARTSELARLEALARMAATTAHDFANILLGIDVFAGFLTADPLLDERGRADAARIRAAVEQGRGVAGALVSLGRLGEATLVPTDVHATVDGMRDSIAGLLGSNIELELALQAHDAVVELDARGLERALINLAVNARDALPDGGHVRIATTELEEDDSVATAVGVAHPGRYLSIEVTDDGIGMDEPTLRRAFEPYFTTKPIGHGTGLGLSSVHALVRAVDGHAHAVSAPRVGTTFRICIPAMAVPVGGRTDGPDGSAEAAVVEAPAVVEVPAVDQARPAASERASRHVPTRA